MLETTVVATYLAALERTGNPMLASRESGLSRADVMSLRESDAAFSRAYDDAIGQAAELLEAEAWRRALDGVPVPLMSGGKLVLDGSNSPIQVRRYSDSLLALLLRGCKPEKFSTRGQSSIPADPLESLKDIAFDHDPPRQQTGRC